MWKWCLSMMAHSEAVLLPANGDTGAGPSPCSARQSSLEDTADRET
jgi:hypothetical protein